jgi:hypothetical protein
MTDSNASLLTRAQAFIDYYQGPEGDDSRAALARDLRNRVVELEAFYKAHTQASCTNPTCDCIEGRLARAEAQQSSLREKIETLREAVPVGPFATHEYHAHCSGLGAAYGNVLALLSDTETP